MWAHISINVTADYHVLSHSQHHQMAHAHCFNVMTLELPRYSLCSILKVWMILLLCSDCSIDQYSQIMLYVYVSIPVYLINILITEHLHQHWIQGILQLSLIWNFFASLLAYHPLWYVFGTFLMRSRFPPQSGDPGMMQWHHHQK